MGPDNVGTSCKICNKKFFKRSYCARHMKNVHKINGNGETILAKTNEPVFCTLCNKKFSEKRNLKRHTNTVHLSHEDDNYHICAQCDYKTVFKCNLGRHMTRMHKNGVSVTDLRLHKCNLCSASYKWPQSLKQHERKSHGIRKTFIAKRKCPLCTFTTCTLSNAEFYCHFERDHNIILKWETHHFNSLDVFRNWKKEIEKHTFSSYVNRQSSKSSQQFQCHRSGVHKRKGVQRRLKKLGSCKINGFCPAAIRLKISENGINVRHQTIHVGHANELKHLRLSNEERISTVRKVPHEKVLKEISCKVMNSDLRRGHSNQAKCFKPNQEDMLQTFDRGSVEVWVDTFKSLKDTDLIIYKPQGKFDENMPQLHKDDFLLILMTEPQKTVLRVFGNDTILIDATNGLNKYSLELFTLMVLDESREGFPVAFMFSNRGDENIMSLFFDEIKKLVGIIECDVFISDIDETFYTAWTKVMSHAKRRIFYTRHVLKDWKKNVNSKIKNKEKRDSVFKTLKTIMYELDLKSFDCLLESSMLQFKSDEETVLFYDYFENHYINNEKYKCWAYSFRVSAGISIMSFENFNKLLKYTHLRGKKVARIDKPLCEILNLLKDKLFDLLIKLKKSKFVGKRKLIRKRHRSSLLIDIENVVQENDKWRVLSPGIEEFYVVKRIKVCNSCQLECSHCSSCLHEYVCSCVDSLIKNNMCEHIHAVARKVINSCLLQGNEHGANLEEYIIANEIIIEDEGISNYCVVDVEEAEFPNIEEERTSLFEQYKEFGEFLKLNCTSLDKINVVRKMMEQTVTSLEAMNEAEQTAK